MKELYCEFCGSYGDCAVCRSMLPDPPSRSFAPELRLARSGPNPVDSRLSGQLAALALIAAGITGLVWLAVAALVGW